MLGTEGVKTFLFDSVWKESEDFEYKQTTETKWNNEFEIKCFKNKY